MELSRIAAGLAATSSGSVSSTCPSASITSDIGPPYRGGRNSINTKIGSLVAPSSVVGLDFCRARSSPSSGACLALARHGWPGTMVDIPLRCPPDRLGGGTRVPSQLPHHLAVVQWRREV